MSNKPKLPLLHTTVMNVKSLPPVPHVIPITHPNTPTMLEHQTLVGLTSTSNGKKSENDRPYHCPACQKKFRQMGHLQQHIRIHTNDRPYQCAHCDKRFKQRSQVNQHERIHTGEKPYQCNICFKTYPQAGQVYSHKKSVHKVDPLKKNRHPDAPLLERKLEPKPKRARKPRKLKRLNNEEIESMIGEIKNEEGPLPPVYVYVVDQASGRSLYTTPISTTRPDANV